MGYFNNRKAQTLTEFAAFGSVLLLVLSFFISYGMRYNYQQDVQMRAFRMALSEAYNNVNNRPDASASVVLVEDKHIPDPRDMFGAGNIVPVQGGAEVVWGNSMQDQYPDITDNSLLPKMKYAINGTEREYRTAGYGFIAINLDIVNGIGTEFYAILPGKNKPQLIDWLKVKCYQPTPDSPKQAMVMLPDYETEVINEVYLRPVGSSSGFIKYQIIGVRTVPETASNGAPVDRLNLLSPDSGQINPNYMQLNNDVNKDGVPDVTQDNVQGLLLDSEQKIRRSGTLAIEETPGKTISTGTSSFRNSNGDTIITHKIRSSSGTEDINYPFERNRVSTWTTPK